MKNLARKMAAPMAIMLALCAARPAHAQVTITTGQSLNFGLMVPGTPVHILPSNVAQRAELTVDGTSNVVLQFVLPTSMRNAAGRTIPLSFAATDCVVTTNKTNVEDPNAAFSVKLTPGHSTANITLGGTATPATGQVAGSYTATITLMVVSGG